MHEDISTLLDTSKEVAQNYFPSWETKFIETYLRIMRFEILGL